MKFAIDLLWVRKGKIGGTESYVKNLLDGMVENINSSNDKMFFLVSKDNKMDFLKYSSCNNIEIIVCNIYSKSVWKRILWQNLYLGGILKRRGIKICFEPIYSKPIFGVKGIDFVTTIHDLQALHYPEYQGFLKLLWLKFSWKNSILTSKKIIAISRFVYEDIVKEYKVDKKKIHIIYNPIKIEENEIEEFSKITEKYHIRRKEYYYTVSSLLPHKNLITLIKMMNYIVKKNLNLPQKLVISGVGDESDINKVISIYHLSKNIIFTGFISNAERNSLYRNCNIFLFPSLFEGFGMPLIEASFMGCKIITTNCTAIPEISQGKLIYVKNPKDEKEWIKVIEKEKIEDDRRIDYSIYDYKRIGKKYLSLIKKV